MACEVGDIFSDACANGFLKLAQSRRLSEPVILELAREAAGSTESFEGIYARACTNGFDCLSVPQWRAAALAALCPT